MTNVICRTKFSRIVTLVREYKLGCCAEALINNKINIDGESILISRFLSDIAARFLEPSRDVGALFDTKTSCNAELVVVLKWAAHGFKAFLNKNPALDDELNFCFDVGCKHGCYGRIEECSDAVHCILKNVDSVDSLCNVDNMDFDLDWDLFDGAPDDFEYNNIFDNNSFNLDTEDLDNDIVEDFLDTLESPQKRQRSNSFGQAPVPDVVPVATPAPVRVSIPPPPPPPGVRPIVPTETTISTVPTTTIRRKRKRQRKAPKQPVKAKRPVYTYPDGDKVAALLLKWDHAHFMAFLDGTKTKRGGGICKMYKEKL